ncbi:serine hydrolase [Virgisporangium ochraceum]|uniref:Beta-lactamase-related domain-containing protein n=1 Tax=Virgisporangium ochraceum TaxID=65505 RepID=A0A8J4A6J7_9ACTN|nr:serine hydrolase [Virgisporangium ochraceum]GIJ74270.1 hypothetical protein Voc01_091870 [Virgisporangium ochraceum]
MIQVPAGRRRLARLVGAALVSVATAVVLTVAPTASADPGAVSKAWDPDETAWASVRARTADEFAHDVRTRTGTGYLLTDLEADTFGGDLRLGGVFHRNPDRRRSVVEPRLTGPEYRDRAERADAAGLRLVDLEVYDLGGVRHYAAAWVEDVEGLAGPDAHDLTYDQLLAAEAEQRRLGRRPVDFDAYPTPAGTRYAVVWVDNPQALTWRLDGDLSAAEYERRAAGYAGDGLRQVGFDSVGGRYGGIWTENRNLRQWLSYRDLSARQYANLWHRNVDLGYREIFAGTYRAAGGVRYASIWRANSDRPTWPLRGPVDATVDRLVGSTPGVSVSVVQRGRTVYQRGFGHADLAGDVWMDSDHVLRTASVAKAVAGILTLRLEEQGVLSRKDTVAGDLPGLPAQHRRTTYEEFVSNRGCVRHYGGRADAVLAATGYRTARDAAPLFWNDPLVAGCTVGVTDSYSTHGYTLAAAGMEAASGGTPVADLLRQRLCEPLGLTTLRQENPSDPSVRRSKIYEGRTEVPRDQLSWKTLGGGLETTPKDLTRLGSRLLAGAVLGRGNVEYLWSGTGWGYSYGFGIGSERGHRRAAKNGSQRGADSFWLIYPDDGIVIAVMANRKAPGGGVAPAEAIANEIGRQMLASLG